MAAKLEPGVIVAGGAAALAGYHFLLRPYLAAKAAAAAPSSTPSLLPSLSPVTFPTQVGPSPSAGGQYQGSIVDPRVSPGGDVGQAMWRKNWTQLQAATRLNAIKAAAAEAKAKLAQLRAPGQVNAQAAALISQGQQKLAEVQAVAANDRVRQAAALNAGDLAGAAAWEAAAISHEGEAREIAARISATSAAATQENSGAIAAYETALANQMADYLALTGYQLAV